MEDITYLNLVICSKKKKSLTMEVKDMLTWKEAFFQKLLKLNLKHQFHNVTQI